MRILLTGGYGCIGSWIVRNLSERGDQAWIYDLKEDPRRLRLILPEEQVRQVGFIQGDVTDLAGLRRAIEHYQITHVVHLAGLQVPADQPECRGEAVASHAQAYHRSPFDPFPAERTSQPRLPFSSFLAASAQVIVVPAASVSMKDDATRST